MQSIRNRKSALNVRPQIASDTRSWNPNEEPSVSLMIRPNRNKRISGGEHVEKHEGVENGLPSAANELLRLTDHARETHCAALSACGELCVCDTLVCFGDALLHHLGDKLGGGRCGSTAKIDRGAYAMRSAAHKRKLPPACKFAR